MNAAIIAVYDKLDAAFVAALRTLATSSQPDRFERIRQLTAQLDKAATLDAVQALIACCERIAAGH